MSAVSAPTLGNKATFGFSTTLPATVYTNFATAKKVGLDPSVGEAESTILSSAWKTYLPTMPDGGEVTFGILYQSLDAGVVELQSLLAAPALIGMQLQLNDGSSGTTGSTIKFTGFLKGFPISGVEVETLIESEVKFRITGAITFTAAT